MPSLVSQRLKRSPSFISVAVQTSPPLEPEAVDSIHQSSSIAPARTRLTQNEGVTNVTADIQALVSQLSDAMSGFQAVSRSVQGSLKSRQKPTDTSSGPSPVAPHPTLGGGGVPPVPRTPPQHQLAPELSVSHPSPNKTQPNFQHILRVEHECTR